MVETLKKEEFFFCTNKEYMITVYQSTRPTCWNNVLVYVLAILPMLGWAKIICIVLFLQPKETALALVGDPNPRTVGICNSGLAVGVGTEEPAAKVGRML
jgi:hypothetical protein